MKFDVTSYGEIGLRLSPADGKGLSHTDNLSVNVIGTEFNVLSNLAGLGWRTALMSAVPETPLGERAKSAVRELGVNDDLVQALTQDDRIGIYFVDYGAKPKPTSVYFDRKLTAFTQWEPNESQLAQLLDTRILHLSGLSLALSDQVAQTSWRLLEAAKQNGVTVSFDINHRRKLWSAERAAEISRPFIEAADVLIAPTADVKELFGSEGDAQEAIAILQGMSGAKTIAVTDADRGARAVIDGKHFEQAAAPVEIIDRLGAGDGFAAGLIHALLSEIPNQALVAGTTMAALALSQQGEQVTIQRTIFEQIMAGNAGRLQR